MTDKIILNNAYKGFTLDQDKIVSPEETVKALKDKLKEIDLNILDNTDRIDNGRLDIPVYFSRCGKDAESVTGTKKQMGKGGTPQQAEASAVMELVERFSFFSFSRNPNNFIIDKAVNLKEKAIDFSKIAQSVHDESKDLDITKKIYENLSLKWTRAYNLTRQELVLIPFDWFYTINEFNGPCAGNCVEEALIQGICEIVERHVSSIISQQKIKTPAIRPDSATDEVVLNMLAKYKKAGIKLYITDFSLDTGIPSVGVLAYDPSTFPKMSEIVWTAGTTPNPEKALSRALTETAQLAGDFNTGSNYIASGLPKFSDLNQAGYIMNSEETIDINELPDLSSNNMKTEVENLISVLKHRGMDVYVIDIMHPLLKTPGFYTIIPGAHFRERATGTSVGMFSAKIITENLAPYKAIDELNDIKRMLPGKYYINFYLGLSTLALNNPSSALQFFHKALDQDPTLQDIPSIYSYMGICHKEMEEYKKAIEVLEAGAKFDPDRTDIYNLLGFCHFKLKKHDKAIENFKRVLHLDPSSAIDYANIASNYRDMGQKEKAMKYYLMALTIDPSIEFARINLEKLQKETNK